MLRANVKSVKKKQHEEKFRTKNGQKQKKTMETVYPVGHQTNVATGYRKMNCNSQNSSSSSSFDLCCITCGYSKDRKRAKKKKCEEKRKHISNS